MATVTLTTILDPAALLERSLAGLLPLAPSTAEHPWPTLSSWIVLRQGGLRDDLHRMAANRGVAGWFDPPICLFNEVGEHWSTQASLPALTEPERLAMLSGILDRFGGTIFSRATGTDAWVPPVDRLIGELISDGIDCDEFTRALTTTASDTFARARAEVLGRIYHEWIAALAVEQRTDGRDARVRLSREISANAEAFAKQLGGRREVRIVGLADLRGGWRQLIEALAATPALDRVELLCSSRVELPASLSVEYGPATLIPSFADALFTETLIPKPSVRLVEAPDAAREVELIAVRVRALIDAGVSPSRIAVVARQARPLVNDMSDALARLGVPASARRRTGLAHTAPARALRAMLAVIVDGWSRHSVVELAEHPLLATGVDPTVANFVGYAQQMRSRADWRNALAALVTRCEKHDRGEDPEDEYPKRLPPTEKVAATLAAWDLLSDRLAMLESVRPLAEWFEWVHEVLTGGAWAISDALTQQLRDVDVWQADVRARDLIAQHAMAWSEAVRKFGADSAPVDAASFAGRLELLLEQDLITPPLTDFGVVVAEALAAGWRGFDHLFVIGLSAGIFPQRPGAGGVLDDDDRRALIAAGLPLDAPDAWRTRESDLFRVLCAAPRSALTISWPVLDSGGRDTVRSTFVDEAAAVLARAHRVEASDEELERMGVLERIPTFEALVPGFPVVRDAESVAHAQVAAAREIGRTKAPSAWNGLIEDPAQRDWIAKTYDESFVWSATQLEQAAKCRWHWFAQRLLRLDAQAEADDQMEPTVRGTLLHDALDRFFKAARVQQAGVVAYLRAPDADWARPLMVKALDEAWTAAAASKTWLGPEALRSTARAELQADLLRYLDFEIEYNDKSFNPRTNASKQIRTGAFEGEFRFDRVELHGDGVTFLLRGSVDRVDLGQDDRIEGAEQYMAAIDYKSSKYSVPAAGKKEAWGDRVVLQVPLYAAAMQKERPDLKFARMEYRSVRPPEVLHVLSLAPVKAKAVQDAPDAQIKLQDALDGAGARISQIRAGDLPTSPTKSCACSPYCPARDICRIPGGPEETW